MRDAAIDDVALASALRRLLPLGDMGEGLAVVARRPNEYTSSSRGEILTVRLSAGTELDLFVKHARDLDPLPRCRHGVDYCAAVNRHLVARLPLPHARFFGVVAMGDPPMPALVVEHLAGSFRVGEAPDESAIVAAAEWCGRFHRHGETLLDEPALAFLSRYDEAYYSAWATRAVTIAAAWGLSAAWLGEACAAFARHVATLAAAPVTTIHGEFGPQNVLWRNGEIHPVDWESAAIGPGEIDLVTLLFGWPEATIERSVAAYWEARGVARPASFAEAWRAAMLYTALRWVPPAEAGAEAVATSLAEVERAWRFVREA